MNAGEVAIISSGLAMARVENEKFIADLSDVMRNTIKDASNMDLILLSKGAFYMRPFPHSQDVYSLVHATSMSRFNLGKLSKQEVKIMS
jgi:hypothetical protein